jgi:uncharacterized protein (TIGR00255 family)
MKSMTGFGIAELNTESGVSLKVNIVSYNKKQLDIRVLLPKELLLFEHITRKFLSGKISRGSVSVRISVATNAKLAEASVSFNKSAANAYLKKSRELCTEFDISGELNINTLVTLPGVIEEPDIEHFVDEDIMMSVINSALEKLLQMRKNEGEALKKDIASRLITLSEIVNKIEPEADTIPQQQHKRLMDNLRSAGLDLNINDERVMKEIIIFSDRYDISEEITRLRSHFIQFRELMEKNGPVGRSLEFLVQELQREINTLGNKAIHSKVSPGVVQFKTELEKIREQVQNVE